ncbi:40S ribosomal S4-like [Fagus crenata]
MILYLEFPMFWLLGRLGLIRPTLRVSWICTLLTDLVLVFRTSFVFFFSFSDVVSIPKTTENFRLLYDTKGRFRLHSIRDEEAKFKLCKVHSVRFGQKGIPYLNNDDANDTIKLDLEINKITDFVQFDVGNVVIVTGGRNRDRVGVIKSREKHKGSFETVHIQDALGHEFANPSWHVFTVGKGHKAMGLSPQGQGYKIVNH